MLIGYDKQKNAIYTYKHAPAFIQKLAMFLTFCLALWMAFLYWLNGGTVTSIGVQRDEDIEEVENE